MLPLRSTTNRMLPGMRSPATSSPAQAESGVSVPPLPPEPPAESNTSEPPLPPAATAPPDAPEPFDPDEPPEPGFVSSSSVEQAHRTTNPPKVIAKYRMKIQRPAGRPALLSLAVFRAV